MRKPYLNKEKYENNVSLNRESQQRHSLNEKEPKRNSGVENIMTEI